MANGVPAPADTVARSGQSGRVPLLPAMLVLVFLAYISVFLVLPEFIADVDELLEAVPLTLRIITGVVLFGIFLIMIISTAFQRTAQMNLSKMSSPATGKPVAPSVAPFKPVVPSEGARPQAAVTTPAKPTTDIRPQTPTIFTYPLIVEGGIYGDTFVRINDTKVLRVRSMVVEPEQVR